MNRSGRMSHGTEIFFQLDMLFYQKISGAMDIARGVKRRFFWCLNNLDPDECLAQNVSR